ncbi:aspartate aminotransferase family protein [Halobacillus sp. Marseille-Q1614]|uniref:pyridoxal phosphate-dependent decarboxylase family protein n=1 Tax=Halobacillus sp. Marseille-Q1614 TaxID=2709134 RepID=UPI00156E6837|nr:aspartate aminotransferase family protein [Halobacillus sp. Marseille-Q1614]
MPAQITQFPETAVRSRFDHLFLNKQPTGIKEFEETIHQVVNQLIDISLEQTAPYRGKSPQQVEQEVKEAVTFNNEGEPLDKVLEMIEPSILQNSLHVTDEKSMGHLHCPPLIAGVAAELIISAYNQSMDSWDQSTAATFVEEEMIGWLTGQFGLGEKASGVFSSGGTQSNYMGLLLARDAYCDKQWNHNVKKHGLPPEAGKMKILCSEEAHFTVKKSAFQLGLGEDAVVSVSVDQNHRMSTADTQRKIEQLIENGDHPFAIVGTCGTTDFGSIDPLSDLASLASRYNVWFHADAAYGGALILSESHASKLKGLEMADSITVDFHKLFYQPISCGAFLVNDERSFKYINHHADYLNPQEDEEEGIPHLVNKSIATTRRFDALKLFMTLKVVGLSQLQQMVDHTFITAKKTADYIQETDHLSVANPDPELNTVLFRFESNDQTPEKLNEINRLIQKEILFSGKAIVAKTKFKSDVFLKFTLLNPRTSIEDTQSVLKEVQQLGYKRMEEREAFQ